MSLTGSLHFALSGLRNAERNMTTVASNITNADRAGYTKKTYQARNITTPLGSLPINGDFMGARNEFLTREMVKDIIRAAASGVRSEYLSAYTSFLGRTDGTGTLNQMMGDLYSVLDSLALSPENTAIKAQVVSESQFLASQINTLSSQTQDLRLKADQDIASGIETINSALRALADLNAQITQANSLGGGAAEIEDQRLLQLEILAEQVGIQYFVNENNQMKVYTQTGQVLLDSVPRTINYVPQNLVNEDTVFNPIELNGLDITNDLRGGRLEALVDTRDNILVAEHDKLNELAVQLMDRMNELTNNGATYPARSILTGEAGFAAGDAIAPSAGTVVRIALLDQAGVVQSFTDLDISAWATVGDAVAGLNGLPGINASLDGAGRLVVESANPNLGIAMNQLSGGIGTNDEGLSQFFGLNNLFDGSGARDIRISQYLANGPGLLAVGSLSTDAALAVGDVGLTIGDGSIARAMANALTNQTTAFNAAGNFNGQTNSLMNYASNIVGDAATRAEQAERNFLMNNLVFEETKKALTNVTGVNIDEETARMLEFQSHYEASAMLVGTIRNMFEELLAAVR